MTRFRHSCFFHLFLSRRMTGTPQARMAARIGRVAAHRRALVHHGSVLTEEVRRLSFEAEADRRAEDAVFDEESARSTREADEESVSSVRVVTRSVSSVRVWPMTLPSASRVVTVWMRVCRESRISARVLMAVVSSSLRVRRSIRVIDAESSKVALAVLSDSDTVCKVLREQETMMIHSTHISMVIPDMEVLKSFIGMELNVKIH